MKPSLFILLCILYFGTVFGQDVDLFYRDQQLKKEEETKLKPDSLVYKSGYVIKLSQMLKIGTGTMPDGSFKFIRINNASLFSYSGNSPNAANGANALPPEFSGRMAEVNKIQVRGNKKFGYQNYVIVKVGAMARYEIDIDNAISTGEVKLPDEFVKTEKSSNQNDIKNNSLADEILKLKKLYDSGILSKEEFETAKKKLLSQ